MEEVINIGRLSLRSYSPEISRTVFSTFNDEELKVYFGLHSDEELKIEKQRYEQELTMYGRKFHYFYIVQIKTGKVVGWCGYNTWYTRHSRAEIGHVLNKDEYKRKGYISEVLPHVIRYGFEVLMLHRIEALIAPDHTASLKLAESNGFAKEWLLREHYFVNNSMEDSLIFSLLNHEHQLKNTN